MSERKIKMVVFDCNAYRYLVSEDQVDGLDDVVFALVAKEEKVGLKAYASPVVVMEMLALLDDSRKGAEAAARYLRALECHCRVQYQGRPYLRAIHDPETILCRVVFEADPPADFVESQRLMVATAQKVASDGVEDLSEKHRSTIRQIANHVRAAEKRFIDDLFDVAVRHVCPEATTWAEVVGNRSLSKSMRDYFGSESYRVAHGRMLVGKCCDLLQRQIDESEEVEKGTRVADYFKAQVELIAEVLTRLVVQGCRLDRRNRGNWYWDLYIASVVGLNFLPGSDYKVLLVTSDKDILAAAKSVGHGDYVCSYEEYHRLLDAKCG